MRKLYLVFLLLTTYSTLFSQITLTQETNSVIPVTTALVSGATTQNIFGIKLAKPVTASEVDLTSITVHFNSNPALVFSNPQIWRSTDDTFGGDMAFAGSFSGNTAVFTSSPITSFGTTPFTAAADRWFFLTVDVLNTATGTIQPSVSSTDFIVSLISVNGPISFSGNNYSILTTTIGSLNSVATNKIAPSPLVASSTGNAIFGFSLTSGGTQSVTAINVQLSSDPSGKLSTYSLVRSTDNDFSTTGDNTTIGGLTFTPTATQVAITGLSESITSTSKNYFLVANVNSAVIGATPSITPSLGTANITVGTGTVTGSTASGTVYSFAPITTTIGSLNAGANNIAGPTLTAGLNGQGIFGFSLTSNGSQTVSVVNVQLTSDPSGKLSTFSLVRSADADFSTTGDNTTIGGLTFTPTATQVGITGLSEALSSTAKNYFLVANVDPAVTGTTPSITPSLGASNITAAPTTVTGSSTGQTYNFQGLSATITATGGIIPLVETATAQSIFTFSAASTGAQTLTQLDFVFSTDIAAVFNTSNFVLKNGVTTVGTPSYNTGTSTLTFTGINVGLSSLQNFTLLADLLANGVSSQTISLSTAGVTTSGGGTINAFTTVTNTLNVSTLVTTVTSSGGTIAISAGSTSQQIFSLSAASNASQSLSQLKFIFSVDISTIFNTSAFVFKNGVTTVGTPSYNVGTKTLTISGIGVSLSTTKNFTLEADVLSTAPTSSQTVSLSDVDVTVTGGGTVNTFTTVTNTLNVAALGATLTEIAAGTSPVMSGTLLSAGTTAQVLTGFSVSSSGSQQITAINFNISGLTTQLSNVRLFKSSSAGTVGASIATNASGNFTGLTQTITSTVYYYLVADVLASATASTTSITTAPTEANVTFSSGGKNTMSISRTFTFNSSQLSSITLNGGTSTGIAYTSFVETDADLTAGGSINIATFRIIDPANDPDNLGTTLTDLTLTLSNFSNIERIALYDGGSGSSTEIAGSDKLVTSGTIIFSGLTLTANDNGASNGTKDFTVRVSFKSYVIDNQVLQVTVSSATSAPSGSGFSSANAGGASSGAVVNDIEVTATRIIFIDPLATPPLTPNLGPLTVTPNPNPGSTFSVTVWVTDANYNLDLDNNSTTISLGGVILNGTTSKVLSSGVATFGSLSVNLAGNYSLSAGDAGALSDASTGNGTAMALSVTSLGVQISDGVTSSLPTLTTCYGGAFQTYPNIKISETDPADFAAGGYFMLQLPAGFIFDTSVTPNITKTGNEIAINAIPNYYINNDILRFKYSISGTSNSTLDEITISGLKVRYPTATTPAGSDILVLDAGATQVKNAQSDAKSNGKLIATTAANAAAYDFSVKAIPGQPAVLKNETRFSFLTNGIVLSPANTNPDSTNYSFTGNGVSFSLAQNRYIFSPSSVGVGNNYDVTLTSTNAAGCLVTVTKTFQVYASSISGLQPEYCANNSTGQTLSVDPSRYSIAQYYPAWSPIISYSAYTYVSSGGIAYYSLPQSILVFNLNKDPASNPTFWKAVGYNFINEYTVNIPSYKSITGINNHGGTLTITSANHGFANGATILLYGYAYDAFFNFIFYVPYANYVISNATASTFDITYNDPNIGNYPNSFGTVYIQNPQVTSVVNNGTSLTLTVPNHGISTGKKVSINLSGLSDNGITSFIQNWYTVTNVTQNTFDIVTTATGSWTGSGYVDIFNYRFSNPFTPSDVSTFNGNLGTITDIYVGFLVTDVGCVVNASQTCAPFTYSSDPVRLNQIPQLDFNVLNSFYCKNSAIITLTGSQDGVFSGGSGGLTDGGPGNKTATFNPTLVTTETAINVAFAFTDNKGCANSITKSTIVHDLPVVAAGIDAPVCLNTPYQIGGAPTATGHAPFTYSWNNVATLNLGGSVSPNPFATPITNTTYTVTGTDVYGCVNTSTITLTVNPLPIVNAGTSGNICSNSPLDLTSIGASISGAATSATWSTVTDGAFQTAGSTANTNFGSGNAAKYVLGTLDRTYVTLSLLSNDPPGPCPAGSGSITVFIDPAPVALPGPDQFICATQTVISLNGVVSGAASSGTWSTTNGTSSVISTGTNSATYTPTNIELLGSTINFKFTTDDPPGSCNADVKPLVANIYGRPTVTAGSDQLICQGATINLSGVKPAGSTASSTTWSVISSATSGTINSPSALNSTYSPDASEVNLGSPYQTDLLFTLTSDDPAGPCFAETSSLSITLYSTPPAPASANAVYCVNDQIQNLTASSTINGSTINWYTQSGYPTTKDNQGVSYNTGVSNTSPSVTTFYATQTAFANPLKSFLGCESLATTDVLSVNPLPSPEFAADKFCYNDFMEFTDLSTISLTNNPSRTVQSWQWDFSDGDLLQNGTGSIPMGTHNDRTVGVFQNPRHQYQNIGTNYNVKLTVTSSEGCVNSIFANAISSAVLTPTLPAGPNAALKVGSNPLADFFFKNICMQDVTDFHYTGKSSPGTITITNYDWDFGDAGTGTNSLNQTHQYAGVNSYDAKLIVSSNLNCTDTITKTINILPYIKSFPYIQDFDTPGHGWFTEGLNTNGLTSWQLNPPNGSIISTASTGTNAWFTRVDTIGTYFNNERSVLNGPCIDVSVLPRPALSFDYWSSTDLRNDGAYMQVSTDNGVSWETLGNVNEGLRWYDKALILGLTEQNGVGQPVGQVGWSGNSGAWTNGKFSLEDYKNESKLRIRYVFGSNPDNPTEALDGFAVDHFKLDSLNRVVLVENFTNTTETDNNADFNNFKSALTNIELVKIQYHTGLKGDDPIYEENTTDPNARVGYYGITNSDQLIPRGYLDGFSGGNFTTPWATNYFSLHSLEDSPFNIGIKTIPSSNPGSISIKAYYTAIDNLPLTAKPVMHVVVVEKSVGTNEYVVRKMLPSAIGTALPIPILNNQSDTLATMTWLVDHDGIDPSQLAIVVFIQDIETHKVYQTKINLNPSNLPTIITGTEKPIEDLIKLYPSPADNEVTIELPAAVKELTPVKMFDVNGRQVHNGSIKAGEQTKTLHTRDFAAGAYIIQIETSETIVRKKIMVMHLD